MRVHMFAFSGPETKCANQSICLQEINTYTELCQYTAGVV